MAFKTRGKDRARRVRRSAGAGSVYERKDGRWVAAITTPAGERLSRYAHSETDARDLLVGLLAELQDYRLGATERQPLAQFLATWLQDVKRDQVRPRTYENYRVQLTHVIWQIGDIPLGDLKVVHVEQCYRALHRAGLYGSTIAIVHTCLHQALSYAVRVELLPRNPADRASRARSEPREMRILTYEEARRLCDAARDTRWFALWTILVSRGLRIGEALALQRTDIGDTAITVDKTVTLGADGHATVGPTKTKAGRRTLEITPEIKRMFDEDRTRVTIERLQTSGWHDHGLVFPNTHGGLMLPPTASAAFRAALTRAELPPMHPHELRHTCASLLLQGGTHPRVVQEMLGHASIVVTLGTYSHVLPAMHRAATEQLDAALGILA